LEAAAVGLGALIVSLATTAALDVTGILAASLIAIVGLFVIPYKRQQAKDTFSQKMEELRAKLLSTLTTQFRNESENSLHRLKEGVGPYTRFVRAERERVEKTQTRLEELRQRVSNLKARTEAVLR
jgi:ABC-type transport system involved in cytochrome bd biosynthesis fused ATPase/permease subunit